MKYDQLHPGAECLDLDIAVSGVECGSCDCAIKPGAVFRAKPFDLGGGHLINGLTQCMWCCAVEFVALGVLVEDDAPVHEVVDVNGEPTLVFGGPFALPWAVPSR